MSYATRTRFFSARQTRRLQLEGLEDRSVPATLFVDDSLIAGTAIASLSSSVQVTNDRDASGTLTTNDEVSIAVGETGATVNLTFNAAAASGDAGSAYTAVSAAIAASVAGDTIAIAKGTYAEAIDVSKPLTLDGLTNASADVVIAPASGVGITVSANGVVIRDLSVNAAAGSGIVASAAGIASLSLSNLVATTASGSADVGLNLTGNAAAGSALTLNGVTVTVGTNGTGAPLVISGFETVNLTGLVAADVATAAASSISLPSGSTTATVNVSVSGSTATAFTASATSLQIGTGDILTLANVDRLNLNGGDVADAFAITPSAAGGAINTINGGLPAGGTGDTLDLNLTGLTGTSITNLVSAAGLSGTFTFTNGANVAFSGVESLADAAIITGTVFNDADSDGIQGSGELGRSSVTVQLDTNADGSVDQTAITGAGGSFAFAVTAAGTQRVRIVVPSGGMLTTTNPADFSVALGTISAGKNFGVNVPGANPGTSIVNGILFNDVDADGTRDSGEIGVNGLTVYLDLNENGRLDRNEPSTLSARVNGVNGTFSLTSNAVGGTADVRVVEKPGFLENTTSTSVSLTDGATQTVDVGARADLPPQATPARRFAVGLVQGNANKVRVYEGDGSLAFTINLSGSFRGGIRVATGDVNGDGIEDVVVAAGPGSGNVIIVFDGATQREIFRSSPFEGSFTGGAFVTLGDIDLDGIRDIIVTPDEGGGPRVVVFKGGNFQQILSFFGIADVSFRGGARAGFADINGDGRVDLIVAAGFGGGPRVAVFDGARLAAGQFTRLLNDFFVFETALRNGTFVAGGDVNGDGFDDLIIGAGPGGGPRVLVLSGQILLSQGIAAAIQSPLLNFFAGNSNNRGGVRIAAKDLDNDGLVDFVTGDGIGGRVKGFRGTGEQEFEFEDNDDNSASRGVFVG